MQSTDKACVRRGFTLTEVIIVVGIITLLVSVVSVAMGQANATTRDKRRVSDVSQLHLGLRLYAEQNGSYPSYPSGVKIGVGDAIDADLQPFLSSVPSDLKNDETYYYEYDSNVNCTQPNQKVVFAKTLEKATGNYSEVCTCTTNCGFGGGRPSNGYVILVE